MLPTSLEVLDLSGGEYTPHKFTGGLPSEWGALTNVKELKIVHCGLDGKPLSIRAELHGRQASNLTLLHRRYPCRAGAVGKVDASLSLFEQADR